MTAPRSPRRNTPRLTLLLLAVVSAALTADRPALAEGAPSRAEGGSVDGVSPQAREHFNAGVALLLDPDGARYEEAYREFKVAYAASRSPRILGNLGFCAMKLERDLEAIDAYTRYLDEAPEIDAVEREQIKRDLVTLRSGVVRVNVTVNPPDATVVDERHPVRGDAVKNVYTVDRGRVMIGLRPGRHVLRARAGGAESPPVEVDATPGSTLSYTLTVAPPSKEQPIVVAPAPDRTVPWVITGVGAAMLAGGATTGILALRAQSDIDAACPRGECPASYDLDGQRSSARTLVTATDVLLIGGGVVTATGIAWLLLSGSSSEGRPPPVATSRARTASTPLLGCGPTGCVAGYRASF